MKISTYLFLLLFYIAPGAGIADSSLCTEDSAGCRELAVEVAAIDIRERIDDAVELNRKPNLLCAKSDPNCCTSDQMPFCHQMQENLVTEARRSYQASSAKNYGDCPWSASVCESFGSFYCGPDSGWNPWEGCTGKLDLGPPSCPSGWKANEFGCEPPPPCRCGYEHNSKGICIPKKCFRNGVRVPCTTICGIDSVFEAMTVAPRPETNLGKYLGERDVQLEAAGRVRAELQSALEALDREIELIRSDD